MSPTVLDWQFSDMFPCLQRRIEPKLAQEVGLDINPSLPCGTYGTLVMTREPGPVLVCLAPLQSDTLAELAAAHEYFHLELLAEGFPMARPTPRHEAWEQVALQFRTMFHDPLVFRRMEDFGYNVGPEYDRHLHNFKKQLNRVPQMPKKENKLDYCRFTFKYVENCVELPPHHRKEIERLFHRQYPRFGAEASKLLSMMDETQFDNPEDCKALMARVLRKYRLGDTLELYHVHSWMAA